MDAGTIKFIAFTSCCTASLAGGYVVRRHPAVSDEVSTLWSRRFNFVTAVILFPGVGLIAVWNLPIEISTAWALLVIPVVVAVAGYGSIPLSRRLGCVNDQMGVMTVACGQGNLGFTLGGYLCYSLLAPANIALAYAVAAVSVMQIVGVLSFFPLLAKWDPAPGNIPTPARLIARTLLDVRGLLLYGALTGVLLAAFHVPYPTVIDRLGIKDALLFAGGFTAYFGIGLRLRWSDVTRYLPHHALVAAIRFLGIPLLTYGLILAIEALLGPLDPVARKVMIIESFMPAALITVLWASLFDMDVRLANAVWLVNTVLFLVIPMPLLIWWPAG